MNLKNKVRVGALAAITIPAIIGSTLTVPAQAAVASGTYRSYTAPNGLSSQYHVYANGIDWSQPVGVVFYVDGDYWEAKDSKVHSPNNGMLTAMGRIANARNMVFVPVISPDKNASGDGITWWENQDANGDYFRSFAQKFIADSGIDPSRVWTMGYSGGAEFITYELNADRQGSWRTGGGSIMVAGGSNTGMQTQAPQHIKSQPMYWWVGEKDTSGSTNPPTWSARTAVETGYNRYTQEGFNTRLRYIPNLSHHDYDLPHILAQSLDMGGYRMSAGYNDISEGDAFYNEISWNSDKRLMVGYADRTFRPHAKVNRASMAAYLYRLAGSPQVNLPAISPFRDVPVQHPAYKEIVRMYQQGITTGWADGTFRPHETVSREAMAAFFYRFNGSPAFNPGSQRFADVNTSNPFYKEIQWLAAKGITTGWPDRTFRPGAPTERNAMAAFLYRYANLS